MNYIRKYWSIAAIAVVLLLLVILRLTGNNFRPDAEKHAAPSFNKSNLISSPEMLPEGDILLISLAEGSEGFIKAARNINIEPSEILNAENIKTIRKHKGPVVLYSPDQSVAARVWMTLAQVGINNLYIISPAQSY